MWLWVRVIFIPLLNKDDFYISEKKKKIYNFQTNTKEKESVPAKLKQSKLEEKRGRTEERMCRTNRKMAVEIQRDRWLSGWDAPIRKKRWIFKNSTTCYLEKIFLKKHGTKINYNGN